MVHSELINRNDYDGFLGIAIGKKAKARKEEKQAVKMEKKRANNAIKLAKAEAIKTTGVVPESGFLSTLKGVGNIVSGITGGGTVSSDVGETVSTPPLVPNPIVYPATPLTPAPAIGDILQQMKDLVASKEPTPTAPEVFAPDPQQQNPFSFGITGGNFPTQKDNKNMPYIIGGAVLVLVLVLVMAMKK